MTGSNESGGEEGTFLNDVTKADIDQKVWLGMGEAIEWITFRGQPIAQSDHNTKMDSAIRELSEALANLEPAIAEQVVEGVLVSEGGSEHMPIPHGIWPQTVPPEEYQNGYFALSPVDDFSELGGRLFGGGREWDRLRIRSFFVRDRWHSSSSKTPANPKKKNYAAKDVRAVLEALTSEFAPLAPLTQSEIFKICTVKFPGLPRRTAIEIFQSLDPSYWSTKRGHRGARQSARSDAVEQLIQKIKAD